MAENNNIKECSKEVKYINFKLPSDYLSNVENDKSTVEDDGLESPADMEDLSTDSS